MKTKLLLIAATIITALVTLNNANAQLAMNSSYDKDFKTLQPTNMVGSNFTGNDKRILNNINLKAVRNFIKRYSATTDAKWYTADDGGFIAKFTEDSVQNIVAYNSAGNWMHTIKRYYEKDMPQNVRAVVKRTYYDYTIVGVEEITDPENENTIFLVYVQDATTIKILRVCNEEMDVLHNYKRGDK